jgi:hypothetical protein
VSPAAASERLRKRASVFADSICDLLNATVADGPRVRAVLDPRDRICYVGYKISKNNVIPDEAIALLRSPTGAQSFLHVYHVLQWDIEDTYLADERSAFGLYSGAEMRDEQMVVRYDYDRNVPENGSGDRYPIAHVHVSGDLPLLSGLAGPRDELSRLHLPVGGKRFRPTLEDLIEFAIVEGFADSRDGWQETLETHRGSWADIQIKTLVRDNQTTAAAELHGRGWTVTPPPGQLDGSPQPNR